MINLNIDHVILLEGEKDAIQYTLFCPAVGAHVNAVPAAKSLRQATPFTAVLSNVQDGVKHL